MLADLDGHLDFRRLMLDDPAAAQAQLAAVPGEVKVPVFINCSIHGNEPNGVDAGLIMLRRLATAGEDDLEAQRILDECIVLFNICQNPDGRIADTRTNANGFDMNRDFLTLTQPETRATAAEIARWVPTVFLDLHGYYPYYLMEPCTAPHNPNYEFDLFIGSALPTSEAMEARIKAETSRPVKIAYRDLKGGFEDYSPIYTPMYAMYYGTAGMTLETTQRDATGTACHFWACWAGALHAADNKTQLLHDQAEQFRRGVEGIPQPDGDVTFPEAYVIPASAPQQRAPLQAARMVEKLQAAGVEVYRAATLIELDEIPYPAGTYVIPMRQSLRGLANTWLWQGTDLSDVQSMYSTCATNLTQLFGFDRVIVDEALGEIALTPVTETAPAGEVFGEGECYLLANESVEAVKMVNDLLDAGVTVEITTAASEAAPLGTYVVVDAPRSAPRRAHRRLPPAAHGGGPAGRDEAAARPQARRRRRRRHALRPEAARLRLRRREFVRDAQRLRGLRQQHRFLLGHQGEDVREAGRRLRRPRLRRHCEPSWPPAAGPLRRHRPERGQRCGQSELRVRESRRRGVPGR